MKNSISKVKLSKEIEDKFNKLKLLSNTTFAAVSFKENLSLNSINTIIMKNSISKVKLSKEIEDKFNKLKLLSNTTFAAAKIR